MTSSGDSTSSKREACAQLVTGVPTHCASLCGRLRSNLPQLEELPVSRRRTTDVSPKPMRCVTVVAPVGLGCCSWSWALPREGKVCWGAIRVVGLALVGNRRGEAH